ncbi:hypothetical protein CJ739_1377 [Mariniflexile rhizosphaerae]|uniref:DUF4403 family protein n=1 Tax=unclassified Mariniflexile TaxID=2643887 RepID=UPI000CC375C4|nr:DUF4403 family protein [Mariniflexile sp. TRM1-10]AXP80466.1 hypothetical protein CJ739_1377 [Mariniflexile sp. TRM1-10]PLB20506.1 MAG: hypothetical protein TRG1_488 [Flavobacteriaceae bacterium FS1-H7996/R]
MTLKPEPEETAPLTLEHVPSFINVPVSVKLKDIENQINVILKGLIYEDKTIEDDDIEIKIWKEAPIMIQNDKMASNNRIKTIFPLKAIIKYRIGTQTLGVNLYKTSEFNLNGVVTLISDIGLSNWKLKSKTRIADLEWKESPSMVVYGKKLPVTYLVNPAIKIFKADIEKSIDAAIEASMDFKPNVLEAIEKLTVPFKMNDDYESWLRIVPIEIYSTDAQLNKGKVLLQMGMKCYMETVIGQQPEPKFDAKKIVLKPVSKMPNHVTSNIIAISTYLDASKIMTKNFSGQEFGSGSKKVTVKNVDIWHKQGKMVIALDLQGSVNGTIYLEGVPLYNNVTKELFFDNLDYVLDTKSKLLRTANWLAKGLILKRIQENCRYSIQSNLDEGKQTMLNYLNNYSPMPGVFVNGTMEDIEFQRIQLTNNAILAFLKVTGDISVTVDGLK